MKPIQLISYVVVAAAGALGGYFAGHQGEATADHGKVKPKVGPVTQPAKSDTARPGLTASVTGSLERLLGSEPLTPANAPAIARRILTEADPVRRMAAVGALLGAMTPENARAIRQGFLESTTKDGRRHDGEWALMVRKLGEVLGEAGFREMGPSPFNLGLAMEGWAAADPDAALAMMQADKEHGSDHASAWLTGLCRKDSSRAFAELLAGKFPNVNADGLLQLAVNGSGLDGAREALQKAIDEGPEDTATQPVLRSLVGAMAETLFHKYNTDGNPTGMFPWLEQQKGQPYLDDALVVRAADNAIKAGKQEETLNFLERMNQDRPAGNPVGSDLLLQMVTQPGNKLDDVSFDRAIKVLQADEARLRAAAAIMNSINPERAARLEALISGGAK